LPVEYPRWLFYQAGGLKRQAYRRPAMQQALAWHSVRQMLMKIVDEFQPDVIYAQGTLPNGDLAARLHQRCGVPFVVGDVDFDEIRDCERWPKRRRAFEQVARQAACLVAIASPMEADLNRLFPGVRTQTVHWGVDPLVNTGAAPRPPELSDRLVIFAVGFFYERKGFPLLVRAFARLTGRHPRAVLRIAGEGTDRPAIEAAIREHGLEECVQLLGALPNARIRQEMGWCDVFALTSWDEPWGVVYTEAMSAG
jgi:glycosyltransferase involved in cell wall biosynthesis